MKKFFAILMTLCMLCAASASLADMEIPNFDDMPNVVLEEDENPIEESSYFGEWVLSAAFLDKEYLDEQSLSESVGFNFMPFVISEGKISQDIQDENGEFHTSELEYVFEAGQLQCTDASGLNFVVELLEDGNVVMTVFIPVEGEEEQVSSLSLYLVHPETAE